MKTTQPKTIHRDRRRKITADDVVLIRRAVEDGETQADVAARFRVTQGYVSKLIGDANYDSEHPQIACRSGCICSACATA